ncbi:MAG: class I SAM-dependent rRNA methyltransferase [Acidobacteriota bacterium]|nr:class I SAM-dependent rRNA methyltransferase [Acidobacteriota bacterium]
MDTTSEYPVVRITRKGVDRFRSGHPWIFRSDVLDIGTAGRGDLVRVVDNRDQALGLAHFSSSSQITLRMLAGRGEEVDLAERIASAELFRASVVTDSTAYRLVHAEADFLPGLIIDRYDDVFAIQTLDQGMDAAMPEIVEVLEAQFPVRAIVARNDSAVRTLEELPREIKVVSGELDAAVEIHMNGFRMRADLLHGQKTGVFLDQRENYLAAARYAKGSALDCFTCTGGFAMHLARTCDSVEAVDSSAVALETARSNAERNGLTNVAFKEADAFDILTVYASAWRKFDTVILDPPAFAKSRKQIEAAARGYKEINLRALRLLNRGGVLVTCSCSQLIGEAMLLEILAEAALDAGKRLRVLERRAQASDHPILLTVPETHYLKCLIVQVC